MAYAQWVIVHVINGFRNGTITIKNAKVFCEYFLRAPLDQSNTAICCLQSLRH